MRQHVALAIELIREAKGGAGDELYVTDHLDAAENHLVKIGKASDLLISACRCALGHLTGNMDGDMDLGDPVELLREALGSEKKSHPADDQAAFKIDHEYVPHETFSWFCGTCGYERFRHAITEKAEGRS